MTIRSAKLKIKLPSLDDYHLNEQIGHILRRANQRHTTIFSEKIIDGLTPTRFAVLATLFKQQPLSQNELGRRTAMDVATIKGVVDRLKNKGFVTISPDKKDKRRNHIALTQFGLDTITAAIPVGLEISNATLNPLSQSEQTQLFALLGKIT